MIVRLAADEGSIRSPGSRRGVAVADDVAAFERSVVLAVGHRADAADGLVHAPQSGDFGVFVLGLCGARSEQRGRKERN